MMFWCLGGGKRFGLVLLELQIVTDNSDFLYS